MGFPVASISDAAIVVDRVGTKDGCRADAVLAAFVAVNRWAQAWCRPWLPENDNSRRYVGDWAAFRPKANP